MALKKCLQNYVNQYVMQAKRNLKHMSNVYYALINQLICITNNECLILHHKAFRADYNSRSTKINAPSAARILVLREF